MPSIDPRGERNNNAKLSSEKVREIRLLHYKKGLSLAEIGRQLGISRVTVGYICRFDHWIHQDRDLARLPRPVHKGGGSKPRKLPERPRPKRQFTRRVEAEREARAKDKPEPRPAQPEPQRDGVFKPNCRHCVHYEYRCTLGFPEGCQNYGKAAADCAAYIQKPVRLIR
jgi:hypothetical protein